MQSRFPQLFLKRRNKYLNLWLTPSGSRGLWVLGIQPAPSRWLQTRNVRVNQEGEQQVLSVCSFADVIRPLRFDSRSCVTDWFFFTVFEKIEWDFWGKIEWDFDDFCLIFGAAGEIFNEIGIVFVEFLWKSYRKRGQNCQNFRACGVKKCMSPVTQMWFSILR